jgi:hypothetical protein
VAQRSDLVLGWATPEAVRFACTHFHYSRAVPTPPHVAFGVWEREHFRGVVVFSRGASAAIGSPFGLTQREICELSRVALAEHDAPVSRIVAIALRLLRAHSPGVRLVVSYADPQAGHVGAVYQAMNWAYLGQTSATRAYRDPTGRVWHPRMVSATGWRKIYGVPRQVVRPDECEPIVQPGKHKYAYPLDPAMRASLDVRPYPKRAADPTGEARQPAASRRFDSDPAASIVVRPATNAVQ